LVDNLLLTSHSVRDGAEGEQYPAHLKDIIQIYSKLKEGAESPDTLTNSQENRIHQNELIGDTSPAGPSTDAISRASTAIENKKKGHYSVEKLRYGNALGYTAASSNSFDDSSDDNSPALATRPAPVSTQKENSQRKKQSKKTAKRYSTEQTMSESNDQKKRMTDAICKMSDQHVGTVINEARINLDKEKFVYHKNCQDNKEKRMLAQDFRKNEHFEKKLTFRVNLFDDSKKQRRLAFLKEARDSIVVQYSSATDDEIKVIFKEELKTANAMYMKALQDY